MIRIDDLYTMVGFRMLTLTQIMLATILSGAVSVLLAAWLTFGALSKLIKRLVSFSAGLMLATSTMQLLPEALDSGTDHRTLMATLLIGLLTFFVLEKFAILRHSHHHEGDGHNHHHGHDRNEAGRGGMLVLVGDSIHNFADGVLLAAAFLTDIRLGWLTAAAIAAHEIPQEVGDFLVLLNAGYTRKRALIFNLASNSAALFGALIGFCSLATARGALPYVLVLSASSFIYVALADLIPTLQRSHDKREAGIQFALMGVGVCLVAWLAEQLKNH